MEEIKEEAGITTPPKISVVVPVYKVESYLRRCVDSILAQTFKDFELILIDDACPDGSGAICDEYVKKDERVHVIHKINGGVSSARNAGIDVARGEWLCFVDSDDRVNDNYISFFGIDNEDAGMFIQGYIEVSPDDKIIANYPSSIDRARVNETLESNRTLSLSMLREVLQ